MTAIAPRMGPMNNAELLARISIFGTLSKDQLASLASLVERRTLSPNAIIIREGDTNSALYVIVSGAVSVTRRAQGGGPDIELSTLGPGEFVGEMTLLDGAPRSATVRALSETECVVLPRWVFLNMLRRDPEIAVAMLPALSRRIRAANDESRRPNSAGNYVAANVQGQAPLQASPSWRPFLTTSAASPSIKI